MPERAMVVALAVLVSVSALESRLAWVAPWEPELGWVRLRSVAVSPMESRLDDWSIHWLAPRQEMRRSPAVSPRGSSSMIGQLRTRA
jgi:hypothetical protein